MSGLGWMLEMLVTKIEVVTSPRRAIERSGGMLDVSDGGLAGGVMIALQSKQKMDVLLMSMLLRSREVLVRCQ